MLLKHVLSYVCLVSLIFSLGVFAQQLNQQPTIVPSPPSVAATAYLLIDANSGFVIAEKDADKVLPPASLTKMMTSYLVSAEIKSGRLNPDDMVNISVKAWKMGGSRMYIREGTQVSVKDLLKGVIIQSGNDASVALAERVAGSEEGFVQMMNSQAAQLGMTNTQYKNSTGWPAEGHYTTPRDLAKLARALINDYPEHYALYAQKYFEYNDIRQPNRNRLLFTDSTVDGVKTGHTEEAGFCLVASSEKEGMRLISVVMGTTSEGSRAAESQKLLAHGFRHYFTRPIYKANQTITTAKLWKSEQETVDLVVTQPVSLTVPRGSESRIKSTAMLDPFIEGPITKHQELGHATITLDGKELAKVPLVAKTAVAKAGFFGALFDTILLFFKKLFS